MAIQIRESAVNELQSILVLRMDFSNFFDGIYSLTGKFPGICLVRLDAVGTGLHGKYRAVSSISLSSLKRFKYLAHSCLDVASSPFSRAAFLALILVEIMARIVPMSVSSSLHQVSDTWIRKLRLTFVRITGFGRFDQKRSLQIVKFQLFHARETAVYSSITEDYRLTAYMDLGLNKEKRLHLLGAVLRAALLVYGSIQDTHPVIKFTDIDYSVFTDAAHLVFEGSSPYSRATYRYTPILAWILVPNIIFPIWGKLLFALCDLLSGALLVRLLKLRGASPSLASLWILNPFVAVISTRGNAESILSLLVIAILWTLATNRITLAAILFGLSVHLKIYPIIYCVPIWFGIDYAMETGRFYSMKIKLMPQFRLAFWSKRRVYFGIVAAFIFIITTYCMYLM